MGITSQLKEVSLETLELLKKKTTLCGAFMTAQYLPESAFWKKAKYLAGERAEQIKQNAMLLYFV